MVFNIGLFINSIKEAIEDNDEQQIEEIVNEVKTYIEDLEEQLEQHKMENYNLEAEVDRLKEEVSDLECLIDN
jgi:predicted RNase H-like nuclease (RuvC/YqgF family)